MFSKIRGPAVIWQWSYIFINVFATLWMFLSGELMGDAQGLPVHRSSWLVAACLVVVLSYWFILGPAFTWIERLPVARMRFGKKLASADSRLGIFLALAQVLFLVFNLVFGVNIAGAGTAHADTALGLIWVALPVDSLFLIYYACARENRYFLPNLIIYIISNVMRGWLGIFLFIIFLEWCRAAREKRFKWKYMIPLGALVLICYPVVLNLKWVLRAAASADFSIVDGVSNLTDMLSVGDYLDVIGGGVMQIIARLQITSVVEEVIRYSSQVGHAFGIGVFKPFWLEGIHGIVYDRLINGNNRDPIGVAFTTIGEFGGDFDVGSWNTNTGWVGWLFAAPIWIPFFVLYTLFLCYLCFYFAKKIGMTALLRDLVWFGWLIYLLPGWLGTFVGFLYSLCVYLGLKLAFSYLPSVRLFRSPEGVGELCK